MERNDFDNLSSDDFFFDFEGSLLSNSTLPETLNSHPSPDSMSSWIEEIENMLMKDEEENQHTISDSNQLPLNNFLAEILVNSPAKSPTSIQFQVVNTSIDAFNDTEFGSSDEQRRSDRRDDKEAIAAADDSVNGNPQKESADHGSDDCADGLEFNNIGELPDDSVPKKRRRYI